MLTRNIQFFAVLSVLAITLAGCSDATGGGGLAANQSADEASTGELDGLPGLDRVVSESDESTLVDDGVVEEPNDEEVIEEEVTEPTFQRQTPLSIHQVIPSKGLASGGEQVEIFGNEFGFGLQVFFGESMSEDIFILDDTRLVALTPARLPGLVDVTVGYPDPDNPGGFLELAVLELGYLFYNPVSVIETEPSSGHVYGGEPITIVGTGFVAGSQVLVGGRAAIQIAVVDDTTILAVTPDAPGAGPVDVHVSNVEGIGTLPDGYVYFENPAVSSVVPPVGSVNGGYEIQVRGAGFVEPLVVMVGTQQLEDVEVIADDVLVGTVPQTDEPGSEDVMVSTSYGTGIAHDGFTYLEDLDPGVEVQILAVTPNAGASWGEELVTVVAKGLTSAADTEVFFGDASVVVKGVDPTGHTIVLETPAGDPGIVDVTVSNSNGSDTANDAYTYTAIMKVYDIFPTYGPQDGGTEITVSGLGFEPGLQLRVGALPASAVVVVDDETITAVTPPGSPGLANVTVVQGGLSDVLVGGFAYQSEMDLWVVDPPQGSQAGGTFIELVGSGFPNDPNVLIGGNPATHVKVESPTKITARTPPGFTGTVDVTVISQTKGTVTLPACFTYFDPESQFGGTWGNEVDGSVNVSVLSGVDGGPIPDAFVMLWTDPATPYQGYTNQMGQVTFSGVDLMGEQMVSASKPGFASSSVVEYNATNITLYMAPSSPPSMGTPPSAAPPIFKGQLVNANKFVPIPWGQCSSKITSPATHCWPCNDDSDCGALACHEIPAQKIEGQKYCTQHCVTNVDCPEGYMCYGIDDAEENQCVPSVGEVTAFCDFTKPHIFAQDYLAAPGLQVNEDFSFEMPIPWGEQAIFCWAGIYDPQTLNFTPYALGLARHVVGLLGDPIDVSHIIEEEIILNHPLNGEMVLRLDNPPNNPTGPNFNYMYLHLDLGSDGTLEFLDHPFSYTDTFVMPHVPKALTGDLYDTSYTVLAGAFSFSDDNLPYSLTLHRDIKKISDDTFYLWGEHGWEPRATGVTQNINDLWGIDANQMVAVGTDGLVIRSVGTSWAAQESGTSNHLKSVHSLPTGEAVAVGDGGTAIHYDGLAWAPVPTGTTSALEGVWMSAPDDIFAVGWYNVRHFDGTQWTAMSGNTSKNLRGVYGFATDDVWAVGSYGSVIHWDGISWNVVPTGTTQNLRAVWGPTPDMIFFVGEGGTVLRWDGVELLPMQTDMNVTFEDVWGTGPEDVLAVGSRGSIIRWDGTQWLDESPAGYDATFLTVGGFEQDAVVTGTHELLLGPMLQVPENQNPSDGGMMGEDYVVSWDVQPGPDCHFTYMRVMVPGLMGPLPEWIVVNDYNVTDVLLPDFPSIEGTPGISPGAKLLYLTRIYKEGFDIDNYSNQDFSQLRWQSWAFDKTTFTKQ